ncbi:MAG: hypothetical protein ACTHW1_02460 [Ancrocorticia sp.]|uniref:hypothetical protein n=1 Tax=Ancrocorticia sp. TaxID=2593684 RepID=UPI003F91C7BF
MTAIAQQIPVQITPAEIGVSTQPKSRSLRLGITLALMAVFLVVAFAGAVADATGVVIASGFLTAVTSLAFIFGTFKDAIESPAA